MTVENWLAFAALCVVFLAVPGRPTKLILACRRAGGSKLTIFSVVGCSLGYGIAASLSLGLLQGLGNLQPGLLEALRWPGLALLILLALRLWRAPLHIGPMADNDNLAHRSIIGVTAQSALVAALNLRTLVFLLALGIQMRQAFVPLSADFLRLEAIFVGLAVLSCLTQAVFAGAVDRTIRRRTARRLTPANGKTMLISARSVSAGYRRIAA